MERRYCRGRVVRGEGVWVLLRARRRGVLMLIGGLMCLAFSPVSLPPAPFVVTPELCRVASPGGGGCRSRSSFRVSRGDRPEGRVVLGRSRPSVDHGDGGGMVFAPWISTATIGVPSFANAAETIQAPPENLIVASVLEGMDTSTIAGVLDTAVKASYEAAESGDYDVAWNIFWDTISEGNQIFFQRVMDGSPPWEDLGTVFFSFAAIVNLAALTIIIIEWLFSLDDSDKVEPGPADFAAPAAPEPSGTQGMSGATTGGDVDLLLPPMANQSRRRSEAEGTVDLSLPPRDSESRELANQVVPVGPGVDAVMAQFAPEVLNEEKVEKADLKEELLQEDRRKDSPRGTGSEGAGEPS